MKIGNALTWSCLTLLTVTALVSINTVAPFTSKASGATITLQPSADTFVSAANPDNNYGDAGALSVSAESVLLSRGIFESYLRFNMAAAQSQFNSTFGAGNWNVTDITLTLTVADPINPLFNPNSTNVSINLTWMQNDAWVEGVGRPNNLSTEGLTWNTRGAFVSGADVLVSNSTSNVFAVSLAPSLLADIQAGGVVSFRAAVPSGDTATSALFYARTFGTASSRPQLSITAAAIPEPGTAAMVIAVLCIGVGLRKSRQGEHDRC